MKSNINHDIVAVVFIIIVVYTQFKEDKDINESLVTNICFIVAVVYHNDDDDVMRIVKHQKHTTKKKLCIICIFTHTLCLIVCFILYHFLLYEYISFMPDCQPGSLIVCLFSCFTTALLLLKINLQGEIVKSSFLIPTCACGRINEPSANNSSKPTTTDTIATTIDNYNK